MNREALAPQRPCYNRAMMGNHYGVCFAKIGKVVYELCTRKLSFRENAIQNMWE
jgi:hypothetical protein